MINHTFEELKASGNLPSPSGVAMEILKLTQDENVNIKDIIPVVKSDPALTGRILKLVNCASFQQGNPIISVESAILKLGINALSEVALSLSIIDSNLTGRCEAFDYDNFWSTSLLRALAMQAVAKHLKGMASEEAFTVGLIAEIGQLALAKIYPKEYSDCLKSNKALLMNKIFCKQCARKMICEDDNARQLLEEERYLFAIDHNQITIAILRDWQLPENIIQAISLYQRFDTASYEDGIDSDPVAAQLKLAAMLASRNNAEFGISEIQDLSSRLGLDNEQFYTLIEQLFSDWSEWKKLLQLKPIKKWDELGYAESSALPADQSLKILVVDDDIFQLELIYTFLISHGYSVTKTTSAKDALNILLTEPHSILITDYMMEPMDGLALSQTLRSIQHADSLYIIMITGDEDSNTMSAAFEAGVNDFICKPISQAELQSRLLGAKRMIKLLGEKRQDQMNIRQYAFELAANTRRLEMLTLTDQLTRLYNRRYATSKLDQEWASYLRNGTTFAILSLDLDKFKDINDNYGHSAGDQVLIHFSSVLQKVIRTNDIACRMGGEEFIVIAPNMNAEQSLILADRICKSVENQQPVSLRLPRLITVSIGVAISDLNRDRNGWEDTIKRSDTALYKAKKAGRNCARVYEPEIQRRSDRVVLKAKLKIRKLSLNNDQGFFAELHNYSTGGVFLNNTEEYIPVMGDMLEVQTDVFSEFQTRIGKVVRIENYGFAVEFL